MLAAALLSLRRTLVDEVRLFVLLQYDHDPNNWVWGLGALDDNRENVCGVCGFDYLRSVRIHNLEHWKHFQTVAGKEVYLQIKNEVYQLVLKKEKIKQVALALSKTWGKLYHGLGTEVL
jgi:glutamine cyclotransferase